MRQPLPSGASGWTLNSSTIIEKIGNRVSMALFVTRNIGITAGVTMFTLPSELRPTDTRTFTLHLVTGPSPGIGWGAVNADGTVTTGNYLSNTAATSMRAQVDYPLT